MKINYPSSSPYFLTPQLSWRIGHYVHRSIPSDKTDTSKFIDAKYQNNPMGLSQDLYNTPVYWFVFMLRNMDIIRDPIFDLNAGITIMVPTINRLKSLGF